MMFERKIREFSLNECKFSARLKNRKWYISCDLEMSFLAKQISRPDKFYVHRSCFYTNSLYM